VLFRDIYILPSGIPAWNVSSKCIIKNKNKWKKQGKILFSSQDADFGLKKSWTSSQKKQWGGGGVVKQIR
jgi:hypothetical protein